MGALLEVKGLKVGYGGIEAVRGLDFSVPEGTIVTMIGANGAGKSSTLLALSGIVKARSGSILFAGREILGLRPDRIVGLGLVQVPEGRAILSPLSVAENLDLGAWTRKDKKAVAADLEKVYGLFPRLAERSKQTAGSLSGGEQQMLAIGRALLASPRLLLLDEPSMGLAPLLVASIFTTIKAIARSGTTVLLVEQNARQALKIADRGIVLSHGKLLLEGSGSELLENKVVLEAFLGKEGG
ncbi:MAG: ABC transporter ATP-binding protein [Treponema sp.]|nr:ABC transporter ATP-binding protein [Treponema sp.]